MFWRKKNKNAGSKGGGGAKPSSADIRAEALANARAARERIGDETIQRIAQALSEKENSPFEQARAKLRALDQDRLADNIRALLDEKK